MQFSGPQFRFPLMEAQLADNAADSARQSFNVVDEATGGVVGHAELYRKAASILLGRVLVGDPQARGQGMGGAIIRALVDRALPNRSGRVIELNVFDWNLPAIRCYEREGFRLNPDVRYLRTVGDQTWTAVNMIYSPD